METLKSNLKNEVEKKLMEIHTLKEQHTASLHKLKPKLETEKEKEVQKLHDLYASKMSNLANQNDDVVQDQKKLLVKEVND